MAFRHVHEIIVRIWGEEVGVVFADPRSRSFRFQYAPSWVDRAERLDLAPLSGMALTALDSYGPPADTSLEDRATWHGVPAFIADSVPDDFGNRVIDAHHEMQGVSAEEVTTLDRLAYVGSRGMGALSFQPEQRTGFTATPIDLKELVENTRRVIQGDFGPDDSTSTLTSILETGTSAGGARAKAVIAWNRESNEVRAGNLPLPAEVTGFEQWLIKFDGVRKGDHELTDPLGYSNAEYVYSLMAAKAGITMSETTLLPEGPRHHFMTRRFDRPGTDGERLHLLTYNALAHKNFKFVGAHSYEGLFTSMQRLGILSGDVLEEAYRRAVFNVLASNNDDHTKNISFLMAPDGRWSLAPAYDLSFAYAPGNRWVEQHLMSINGKFSGHRREDLRDLALKPGSWMVPHEKENFARVADAVASFAGLAEEHGVPGDLATTIQSRLDAVASEVGSNHA